ncbi:MAG TPA: halovibrin HvnA [Pseudomonas sp.]|uniref:halovibrin HvnA n=1 Tax=Pseudomonas sp. TaxID=306 RepID=UPI002ED8219E
MKWIILSLSLLSACVPVDHSITRAGSPVKPAADGATVAEQLTTAYLDTRENCDKPSTPAFLCSGVLFRGTKQSASHHAWNPKPGNTGVSFSYLRKDANFDHIAIGMVNGFIFYPYFNAPPGTLHPQILCAFPIDGYTWTRSGSGCGASSSYPDASDACQSQGINTAIQWSAHFAKGPAGVNLELIYAYVCGFNVQDSLNDSAGPAFYQSLRAMHDLPPALIHKYNELIIAAWPQDVPTSLPIQAFFYLPGGLSTAQLDQQDFYTSSGGIVIPIIKMTLPASVTGTAQFQYNEADQIHK